MSSLIVCVCLLLVVCSAVGGVEFNREKRQSNSCSSFSPCDIQVMCFSGGTCHRNWTTCGIYCECPPGYTGMQCETELEDDSVISVNSTDCQQNQCLTGPPCSNGGTCSWNTTSCTTICTCVSGYSGDTCSEGPAIPDNFNTTQPVNTTVNPCQFNVCAWSNPCLNGGSCVQRPDCGLLCDCTSGYTGEICDTRITTPNADLTGSTPSTTTPPVPKNCGGGYPCYYGECEFDDGVKCVCDRQHTGQFCNLPCYRNCSDKGICDRMNSTAPEECNCEYGYTGDFCEEVIKFGQLIQVSDDWKYWVVGSCVILFLLLGLLLVLAFILMKKRNIFIMQVLYYFQPYEDDDGKQFDAFVSYKSSPEDEHFVYHTLYPELEKQRGFRLCLHQRDFTVGETIANNIMWAIENSRRTILVLSPRYMESDFTRFEYQIAHNEMLKQKHKVIPLLLEDVNQQKHLMDRTLTSILKSITYIEWPKESEEELLKKFWKRLELSLPKRKQNSESGHFESDPPNSYDNTAFCSPTSVELDSISVENSDKVGSVPISTVSENVSNGVIPDKTKTDVEDNFTEKPMGKNELKSFFDEPVNDEIFNKMREKAFEYEKCLEDVTYM